MRASAPASPPSRNASPPAPSTPSEPRGPRRSGPHGQGALAAAERFGLDWESARPSVRAVAAEACARVPEEWEIEGPGVCLSVGDAVDLDPDLLAAMLGPDGLGGKAIGPQFGQDCAADALRPGPVLGTLTEQAVIDARHLTDDELTGAMQAALRQQARDRWQQTMLVAEFTRRREAQLAEAKARGVPRGCRPGEFPDDELACELLITRNQAGDRIEADRALTTRLPRTLAGMAAGTISGLRADVIAAYTASLADADAATADEILAAAAPGLRVDQLAGKAARLEMKLDPEAARLRKEHARNTGQRVELRREFSGNASLAGRELDTADALAAKAYIDAVAVKIRNYGPTDDTLSAIRARVMTELLQGRDPLQLILPGPARQPQPSRSTPAADPGYAGPGGRPSWDADDAENARYNPWPDEPARCGPLRRGQSAPLPAAINLLIPVGSLLGWSAAPAQANGVGLLDPTETRAIVQAASQHPRTRWCATFVNPDGTAAAHACAPGRHPWQPPPTPPPPATAPPPDAIQLARLHDLLRELNLAPDPIAREHCDHSQAEPRYTPSRKLKHLLRARTATCDAPGCNAQAVYCDQDHTTPWPDGPTCQCNLGPKCRRHHRAKQAPGWNVRQNEPGVMCWTLPNGRAHTTGPTQYDQ